jgi:hypothetical protein
LASFGNYISDIWVYTSDLGGGIPAAAKHMGVLRHACLLHSLDTALGRFMGLRGKFFAGSHCNFAPRLKLLVERVRDLVKAFKKATLKEEALEDAAVKVLEMFDKDDAFTNGKAPVSKKVGLDGLTRCKSTGTMLFAVGFQKLFLEQFFDDNDPSSSLRLAPLEWAEVQGVGSIMSHVISLQGKFENATIPTASVSYFLPAVLTDNLRTGPIAMTKFDGTTVEKPLLSLTGLVAKAARDVVVELGKYRGKRPSLAQALAMYVDPRTRAGLSPADFISARNKALRLVACVAVEDLEGDVPPVASPPRAGPATAPVPDASATSASPSGSMLKRRKLFPPASPVVGTAAAEDAPPLRTKEEKAAAIAAVETCPTSARARRPPTRCRRRPQTWRETCP